MSIIYQLGIYLFIRTYRLLAIFQPKAKLGWQGRSNWRTKLKEDLQKRKPDHKLLWVHCASLGEFEQGRPLIEALRAEKPGTFIVLSFFSPSGFEIRKNYPAVDLVTYLPFDSKAQAQAFVDLLAPDLAIFVKYEFWYHHLLALQKKGVPTLLIAGLFRPSQVFFQPWGAWFKSILRGFTHFFVQNEASAQLLAKHGFSNFSIAGDPRVDRVLDLAQAAREIPQVQQFKGQSHLLIAGSTWSKDEEVLEYLFKNDFPEDWKLLIAPHEIGEGHLQKIEKRFGPSLVRFSKFNTSNAPAKVLLIDNIGMLSALYRYGDLAYIGGAFQNGLHNTLEPMAFGLPVIFGPKFEKFQEACDMVEASACFSVVSALELGQSFRFLNDPLVRATCRKTILTYLQEKSGATPKVMALLKDIL